MANFRIFLFILFSLLVACKAQAPVTETLPNPAIQNKLNYLVEDNGLPGMNFSFVRANGEQETYSAGYSDQEQLISMSPDDVLFSGSIGKTYAVALLMQFVEAGKIELNKKWIDYFPEIAWTKRLPNIEEITVEMLVQHRSGLPRYVMKEEVWKTLAEQPDKVWTYEERLSFIFDEEAEHKAGEGWAYSDTNYILIGMLLEKIGGKGYYEQVQGKLLDKFDLDHTYPAVRRDLPNLATAYSQLPPSFQIPPKVVEEGKYVFNPQLEWTGGGIASSIDDLARWAKIYFEAQAFSQNSLNQITAINPNGKDLPGGYSYGMGTFIYQGKLGTSYGHSGFMPGYNALFAYYPKQKIAAAIQINCDYAGRKTSLNSYLDILLGLALSPEK